MEKATVQNKNEGRLSPAAVPTKRGKCMSRRSGQNPSVRIGKRADGSKYFYFQYYVDVAGQEERQRKTEVLGPTSKMNKSQAAKMRLDFISKLKLNSSEYQIPSSRNFAHAVEYYQEVFGPRQLRESTLSVANYHISKHLLPDWRDTPVDLINLDAVNEWLWKKREKGVSWTTIKNVLRTMQRILTCRDKNKKRKPPFSLDGLDIPEQDKLEMQLKSSDPISFSWEQAMLIADKVPSLGLDDERTKRYAMLFKLASASGLRCGELYALKMNDLDFEANTIRVDESVATCSATVGKCKNAAAYRLVLLADSEGQLAMKMLKDFVGTSTQDPSALVFHSNHNTPLRASNVLSEGLHPVLKALKLPKAGMHAFRHGCNQRWELAGTNPAVLRSLMGHTSATMTARYTGKLSLAQIQADFSRRNGPLIVVSENKENEAAA